VKFIVKRMMKMTPRMVGMRNRTLFIIYLYIFRLPWMGHCVGARDPRAVGSAGIPAPLPGQD
jgi:hypothetical protein